MRPDVLRIDPRIFDRFPGVRIGVLVAHGLDNGGPPGDLDEALRAAEAVAREKLTGTLVEHPAIAPWREAYRAFGAKPKKYPSSIEALARRALAANPLPAINPLVDLYNTVSLRHLLPIGGEDLDKIDGPLELRFATAAEPEATLLGRPDPAPPTEGEVIYADAAGAVCRRWNWREAARTALSADTKNAIFVIEALPPAGADEVESALTELRDGLLARSSPTPECEWEILTGPA